MPQTGLKVEDVTSRIQKQRPSKRTLRLRYCLLTFAIEILPANMNSPKVSHDEAMAAYALTNLDRSSEKKTTKVPRRSSGKKSPSEDGLPNAVAIQTIPKKGNYVNHSYSDFSAVPNNLDYQIPEDLDAMSFSEKLHLVLSTTEYQKCISWLPHGRAFRVSIPAVFEKTVCPKFFGHKRFSSFLRQLNNHGFKHLTNGSSRNGYYHEVRCFLCSFTDSL